MGETRRKKEKSIRYRSSLHKSALKQCVAARVREFSRQTEFLYRETGDDSLWLGIEKGGMRDGGILRRCRILSMDVSLKARLCTTRIIIRSTVR